jgi:Tfp pilus assembly protein PilW
MNARSRRSAFTLVELLAAMVAAAMLVLTAGLMLFYAATAMRRDRDGADMQQDGCVALALIARSVRGATSTNLDVRPADLRIAAPSNRTLRVFAQGRDLIYDPGTLVPGSENTLIRGHLVSFAVTNAGGRVRVTLTMEAGGGAHRETLEGSYTCRN